MSLLMDALKRAEQARDAQDGPRPSPDMESSPAIPELSLDPLEPSAHAVDNSETGGFALDHAGADELGGAELSLEPVVTGASVDDRGTGIDLFKIGEEPEPDAGVVPPDETGATDLQLDLQEPATALGDSGAMAPIRISTTGQAEDTSATLPSLKSLQASVDSYFDGTDSLSISMEPVSPDAFGDTGSMTGGRTAAGLRLR